MDDNNNLMLETSGDDEENRELIDEKSNAEIQTENISEEISKEAETAPDEILERSDFDEGCGDEQAEGSEDEGGAELQKEDETQAGLFEAEGEPLNAATEAETADFAEQTTEKKKKKGHWIMPSVIIAICVLVLGIAGGISYLWFFDNSIEGTYVIENPDADEQAIKNYYIFEAPNDGQKGTLKLLFGSLDFEGTYEFVNENGTSKIALDLMAVNLYGTYNYRVEGNKLTGHKIEISDDAGNAMNFVPASYQKVELEPIKNAKMDSKLVGTWQDTAGYGIKYTFNDDNTLIMNSSGMTIDCYYSAAKGDLQVKYQAEEIVENKANYSFDKDALILNQMEFKKVEE